MAEKRNLSVRWVQTLCAEEKIEGAKEFGRDWTIQFEAEKPKDGRIKNGKYIAWEKNGQYF